jgi:tRNA threonylcarbamoyladenosine modification (KEOPS) complex  Pcc1 subunit
MEAVFKINFKDKKQALKAAKTLKEGAMKDVKTKLEIKTINNLVEIKIEAGDIAPLRAVSTSILRDLKTIIEIKEVMDK